MKLKILEYKQWKGNNVRVQSHNKRKGKWIVNPKYEWHQKVISGVTTINFGIIKESIKEYVREV